MNFIDLFTGIGGFSLGFEQAGLKCITQVENNPDCLRLLNKRWPNVKKHSDVKNVGGHNLDYADIICGGFPCQDISKARFGSGDGLAGERSGLWFEFARIVDEVAPEWVVIENNPPLLTSNDGRDFTAIIQTLVGFGYGISWRVLHAKDFDCPTSRRRLFIVARLSCIRSPYKVLFERNKVGSVLPRTPSKENNLPMCLGWDGGLSYERLRQCVVTKVNPTGTRGDKRVSRGMDRFRYRAIANAVNPPIAKWIAEGIVKFKR
jgi:DNA-cytosine methyltransferase